LRRFISIKTRESKIMADNSGGNRGLYFIVGALVVAVLGLGYMAFAPSEQADLEIDLSDGIKIDTN
jgi:hypothetical protein